MPTENRLQIIDPDSRRRAALTSLARRIGWRPEIYENVEEFYEFAPKSGFVLLYDDQNFEGIKQYFQQNGDSVSTLPITAYSLSLTPRKIIDAVLSGVSDFLIYPFDGTQLAESLLRLSQGALQQDGSFRRQFAQALLKKLTPREIEVLRYIIFGGTSRSIAEKIGISPRTVEVYRANVIAKLGVKSTAEAIRIGCEAEIIDASLRH